MERTPEPGGFEAMRINLTVKAGPHKGEVFEFQERAFFVVGRSERANFRLPVKDNSISRIHFMIEMNPPQCRLTDMDSTNGTRVNGQKVAMADLKDGDLITAGKTILLVSMIGTDEPLVSSTETILTSGAAAFDAPLQPGPHAVPTAAPSGQPLSMVDYPSRPRPDEKAARGCRLCGDSLAETEIGSGGSGGTEHECRGDLALPGLPGTDWQPSPAHPGLPGRPRAGPGRHGGCLPGPSHGRRRARGAQNDQTGRRSHSGGDGSLPPRGADLERAGSPEHRVVPRAGRVQRTPLFRDGLCGGDRCGAFAEAASRPLADRPRGGPGLPVAPGAGLRPRQGFRPPRRQAGQHAGDAGRGPRRGQAVRFRPCPHLPDEQDERTEHE